MRPRAVILSTLASAATLGVGWAAWALPAAQQAQAQAVTTAAAAATTSTSPTASASPSTTASATASAAATATQAAAASSSGLKDGSYLGTAISTRYGIVQVTAVISGGQLTDVVATDVNATGGRMMAVPMLRSEALAAQSANIAVISNATYTSDGYMQSLQSALDQAK